MFSRWTVVSKCPIEIIKGKHRRFYLCVCECGVEKKVDPVNLRNERSRSCGCLQKDWASWNRPAVRHDRHLTPEYIMFTNAKKRAKKAGLPFDIEIDDVVIPDVCPLIGIPLSKGEGTFHDGSPSLDKIINKHGYVKGNVWVS